MDLLNIMKDVRKGMDSKGFEPELSVVTFRASKSFRAMLKAKAAKKDMTVTGYLKFLVHNDMGPTDESA